jgi:hypothetical protein|tara:strand:+ start:410 stop:910 length:501 start_codon:yes stop_codon:yes gene_type:complete
MSDFQAIGALATAQAISETSTELKHDLGTEINAKDVASTAYGKGTFIYLLGVASTVVGSVVTFSRDDHQTALAAANAVGEVATAMSINVGSSYGWYQIDGLGVAKGLASLADAKLCYLTATAGSVDDAVVAGDAIQFMETNSALDTPSTGLALVAMRRPVVTNESN